MFKPGEYWSFIFGLFGLGGFLVIPLLWGQLFDVSYSSALPGSIVGCFVMAFAHTYEGQFKIGRLIIGLIAAFILLTRVSAHTQEASFVLPGGILGFLVMAACGRIGVWLGRVSGLSGMPAKTMDATELKARPGLYKFLETSYHAWKAGFLDHLTPDHKSEAENLDLQTFISGNAIKQIIEVFDEVEKNDLLGKGEYLVGWYSGFILTNKKLFLLFENKGNKCLEVIELEEIRSYEDTSTLKQNSVKLTLKSGKVTHLSGMKNLPKQDCVVKAMVSEAETGGSDYSSSSKQDHEKMHTEYSRLVQRVIWDYTPKEGMHTEGQIPPDKEQNARRSCGLSSRQPILALVDCTVLGTSKNCILFTPDAMICHNDWTSKSPGVIRIPYDEFPARGFKKAGYYEIDLGQNQFLNASGCQVPKEILVDILQDIKGLIVAGIKDQERPPGRKKGRYSIR